MKTLDCLSDMSYLELAKKFKNHKSGRNIAIVLIKNDKKKRAMVLAPNK